MTDKTDTTALVIADELNEWARDYAPTDLAKALATCGGALLKQQHARIAELQAQAAAKCLHQIAEPASDRDTHFFLAGWNGARRGDDSHTTFRSAKRRAPASPALQAAPPAPAVVAVPGELDMGQVLSIADVHAEASLEDGVRRLDRGGLYAFAKDVIRAALAAAPAQAVAVPQVFPLQGDESDEDDLSPWQAGSSKPATEGRYLRDFDDEGVGISVFIGGEWTRDGFFASDIQDAPWRGLSKPAAPAQEHATQLASQGQHPDDVAVDALAAAMKAKLARQRAKGYSGWNSQECTQQRLSEMLRAHVDKGDPVDVANFCAFLDARGEEIAPAQAQEDACPILDDEWKRRMLDGHALVRDDMGCGYHPALPTLDEGMNPKQFFAALGIELAGGMAEDQMDMDAYDAMVEATDYNVWTPEAPAGHGWVLVAIFDTEDGPAAWWIREAAPAQAQEDAPDAERFRAMANAAITEDAAFGECLERLGGDCKTIDDIRAVFDAARAAQGGRDER
ncbi:hypothetical protein [Pantoea sp. 18069]|uniref:hypothetical protein n=1 Tax=Pantoea sp. 18069 TaxID=2681415 RepID=UPI00190F848E|nr:hypothetical protein [Pantoea sp. 18069]